MPAITLISPVLFVYSIRKNHFAEAIQSFSTIYSNTPFWYKTSNKVHIYSAMASPLKFIVFVACLLVLVVVAAAQYGGGSDYDANAPSASPRSLSYPIAIIVLLPFMLAFLATK